MNITLMIIFIVTAIASVMILLLLFFGFKKHAKRRNKKPLDPETEKLFERISKKRGEPFLLPQFFYWIALYGTLITSIFIFFILGIIKDISGFKNDPVLSTFGLIGAFVIFIIIFHSVFLNRPHTRKKKEPHETESEGFVFSCRPVMASMILSTMFNWDSVFEGTRYTCNVWIAVPELKKFIHTRIKRFYNKGDKVLIAYDPEKPKNCRIIKNLM